MPNYAPRISLPYDDISGCMVIWSESCTKMAIFEHLPDSEDPTIHVHLLMEDCKYATAEALKREFYKIYPNFSDLKGNKLWSWKHQDYPNVDSVDTPGGIKYLTYMTKGELAPKFVKNISPVLLDKAKALWVNKSPDQLPAESKSEFDVILRELTKMYDGKILPSPAVFKCDIMYLYLKRRKPVPRMGDTLRYAYSAHMILSSDRVRQDRKDDALKSMISDFNISYESGNIK